MAAPLEASYIRRVQSGLRSTDGDRYTYVQNFEHTDEVGVEKFKAEYVSMAYQFHLLNVEANATNGSWTLDTYSLPSLDTDDEEELAAAQAILDRISARVAQATMAYATTSSVTILYLYDEVGNVRSWGDIRRFSVEVVSKFMKRIAPMFTQSYLFGSREQVALFRRVNGELFFVKASGELYLVDEPEHGEYLNVPGWISILVDEDPADPTLVDGVSSIAPHLVDEAVTDYAGRESDPDRRAKKVLEFSAHKRFNIRIATPHFTLKGDVLKAVAGAQQFDIVTTQDNIKPGLATIDGAAHYHMVPQHQFHKVRANPQSLAHFPMILNGEDREGREILVRNMTRLRKMQAKLVMRGETVGPLDEFVTSEENNELKSAYQAMSLWIEEETTLNTSPHLASLNAGRIYRQADVDKPHKLLKQFPASYVVSMSLTSEYAYTRSTGVVLDLKRGTFALTEYGIIVNDLDFKAVAESLGGADQDDHLEVHVRIALDSSEQWGIMAGEIFAILVRNPIGANSDGDIVASEYFVLRPAMAHMETKSAIRKLGKLPELALADLPYHMSELDAAHLAQCEANSIPKDPVLGAYTPTLISQLAREAAETMGIYGRINLKMTFCRLHDIPFDIGLMPEFLIDVTEQTRHPDDIAKVVAADEYLGSLIETYVAEHDIVVDEVAADRISLEAEVTEYDGIYMRLVEHYRNEMQNYRGNVTRHLNAIRLHWIDNALEFRKTNPSTQLEGPRLIVHAIRITGANSQSALSTRDRKETVAAALAARLNNLEATHSHMIDYHLGHFPFSLTGRDENVMHAGESAFTFKSFTRPERGDSQYSNTDNVLVALPMIKRYLEALRTTRDIRLASLPFTDDLYGWGEDIEEIDYDLVYGSYGDIDEDDSE